jgi:hypothetical protein
MEATFPPETASLLSIRLYNPGDLTFQSRPENLRANKSACVMQPRPCAAAFLTDVCCWLYNRTGALSLESESCGTALLLCQDFMRRAGRSAFSSTSILGLLRFTLIYIYSCKAYTYFFFGLVAEILSICPQETVAEMLNKFLWNLILWSFTQIYWHIQILVPPNLLSNGYRGLFPRE